jgi:hypothetical protein
MDLDDYQEWVTEQSMGDRLCECLCGSERELMPEEADVCTDCALGNHVSADE